MVDGLEVAEDVRVVVLLDVSEVDNVVVGVEVSEVDSVVVALEVWVVLWHPANVPSSIESIALLSTDTDTMHSDREPL